MDVDEVLQAMTCHSARLRTTTTTATTTTEIEQDSPASSSLLGSFFSSLSSSIGWSTSPTASPPNPRSVAGNRQRPSVILSPSQALPGAFPVSPAPLIEQSLGLETEGIEDEGPSNMYPDFQSIGSSSSSLLSCRRRRRD